MESTLYVTFLWCPLKTTAKAPCPIKSFLLYTNSPTCSDILENTCSLWDERVGQIHFVRGISGERSRRKSSQFIAKRLGFARTLLSFVKRIHQHHCYLSSMTRSSLISHRDSVHIGEKRLFLFRWVNAFYFTAQNKLSRVTSLDGRSLSCWVGSGRERIIRFGGVGVSKQ